MIYEHWRREIFGSPPGTDPVTADLNKEVYSLPKERVLDYVDQCLVDPEIRNLFTKEQVGIGLHVIFNNSCSDLPFSYIEAGTEQRRCEPIRNLRHLYANYFEPYCVSPVRRVGYDFDDGPIGYLCYMFWDIFVLYPGNTTRAMQDAAIGVMSNALRSTNDNCVVSAIHGLGHWAAKVPSAVQALESWLNQPSTTNPEILDYGTQATSGCIQ
jgi:hypothetical protein